MQTILVVDDYPSLADLFSDALVDTGRYRALIAQTGAAGAALLDGGGVDFAVIDACLPGEISGLELCRRALAVKVPALLITGDAAIAEQCRGSGVPQLMKPFHIDALLDSVEREIASLSENLQRLEQGLQKLQQSTQCLKEARTASCVVVEKSQRARLERQK